MRLCGAVRVVGGALALTAACGCAPEAGPDTSTAAPPREKLTYLTFADGQGDQAARQLVDAFERQTGARIDLEVVPPAELTGRLRARLSTGDPPDVARLTDLAPFRGDLLDLRRYGEDVADEYLDPVRPYVTGPRGELLALPSDMTVSGAFVNTDQFARAGIPLPTPRRPWTWAELVANAARARQANHTRYAIAYDPSGQRFASTLSQFGTDFFGPGGAVVLDPVRAEAAVRLLADLHRQNAMPRDVWLRSGTAPQGASEVFLNQAAPVYLGDSWQVGTFDRAARFGWAAIPNPCQLRCGGFPDVRFVAAFARSGRPQLAARLVAFMAGAQAQRQRCAASMLLPTRKDLVGQGLRYPVRDRDMAVFLTEVKRTPEVTYTDDASPGFAVAAQSAVNQLAAVIAGRRSPAEAVRRMRDAAGDPRGPPAPARHG